MIGEYLRRNSRTIIVLSVFVFTLSFYANLSYFCSDKTQLRFFPPFKEKVNLNVNTLLGAEYYYIARSLVEGKGFGNPFLVETGPTAWMPPLYPFFLAVLLKLFKTKALVACIIVFLKNCTLVAAGMLVVETAQRTFRRVPPAAGSVVYALFLIINFRWFFQITHDSWLLLLMVCILFPYSVFILQHRITWKTATVWGALGGLCMLASPIAGLVWLVLVCFSLLRSANAKPLLLALACFAAVCMPWIIRNHIVFDRLIFMKSNLFHDLYYFNYVNPHDGLVYEPFEKECLVWTARDNPACLYRTLGEMRFMDAYKENFISCLKNDPFRFVSNITTRFLAAFLVFFPHNAHESASLWRSILHALPFLAFLYLLASGKPGVSPYSTAAMIMYITYLFPYIIVSYYIRYAIPLTPLKVLFILWAADRALCKLSKKKPRHV